MLALIASLFEEQQIVNEKQPGRDVITQDFYQLQGSGKSFMVMFYSQTCPHCHQLMPTYVAAAKKLEGVVDFVKFSCSDERNQQYCYRTGINAYPLVMMINPAPKENDSEWYRQFVGERDQASIINFVQANMIKPYVEKQQAEDVLAALQEQNQYIIYLTPKKTVSAIPYKLANNYNDIKVFVQANINKEDIDKYTQKLNVQLSEQENSLIFCQQGKCSVYEGKQKAPLVIDFINQHRQQSNQQEVKQEL